jgi:hypothetical protein
MDNRCVMCNSEMTEGYGQVCYNCQRTNEETLNRKPTKEEFYLELKREIWHLIGKEGIEVTNQNLDWLLERAFKEI